MGSPIHKRHWKRCNKRRRQDLQMKQPEQSYWTTHEGTFTAPVQHKFPATDQNRGGMCPSNLALHHPAAGLLKTYATKGCPIDSGRNWTREEIQQAVEHGNHPMEDSAVKQFWNEAIDKEKQGLVVLFQYLLTTFCFRKRLIAF